MNYSANTADLEHPRPDKIGESMKQYVSRRRRCWILLVQMDPVIRLRVGHR